MNGTLEGAQAGRGARPSRRVGTLLACLYALACPTIGCHRPALRGGDGLGGDGADSVPPETWVPETWVPIPVDPDFTEFVVFETLDPTVEVWTAHDQVVVGRNSTDEPALFQIGDQDWGDYAVELEILAPADQPLVLGVTSGYQGAGRVFQVFRLDADASDWLPLRIEARAGRVRVVERDSGRQLAEAARAYPTGGVGVPLGPGQQLALRGIRRCVWIWIPIEEEPADESDPGAAAPSGDGERPTSHP